MVRINTKQTLMFLLILLNAVQKKNMCEKTW